MQLAPFPIVSIIVKLYRKKKFRGIAFVGVFEVLGARFVVCR